MLTDGSLSCRSIDDSVRSFGRRHDGLEVVVSKDEIYSAETDTD